MDVRPGQWDQFTDAKTEIAAAAHMVRDAHWQISRVRRFVHTGKIAADSVALSLLETRLTKIAVELEGLEDRQQGGA